MPSASIHKKATQHNMKKKRIVYGVQGMMEYQALIKIGKATLKVLFTDGSITAFGQKPAQYTTTNFLVQRAIEGSADFRRGRIKIVSCVELDEDVHIEGGSAKAEETQEPVKAEAVAAETKAAGKEETAEVAETAQEEAEEDASGVIEVEFDTNSEAKEYLKNTFGVTSSMRTRADIVAAGATYGVKISFTD